jgi:hypothetical protein
VWWDDLEDARYSIENLFCINERLEYRSVAEHTGEGKRWELEFHQMKPNNIGQFLKYDKIEKSEFDEWIKLALELFS